MTTYVRDKKERKSHLKFNAQLFECWSQWFVRVCPIAVIVANTVFFQTEQLAVFH